MSKSKKTARRRAPTRVAAPRRDPTDVQAAIVAASKSDLLWTLPVLDAMKHFRLRHAEIRDAKTMALTNRPKEIVALRAGLERTRRFNSAVEVERLHPHIHRRVAENSTTLAELSRKYDLSRMRLTQINQALIVIASDLGIAPSAAAAKIESARSAAS